MSNLVKWDPFAELSVLQKQFFELLRPHSVTITTPDCLAEINCERKLTVTQSRSKKMSGFKHNAGILRKLKKLYQLTVSLREFLRYYSPPDAVRLLLRRVFGNGYLGGFYDV